MPVSTNLNVSPYWDDYNPLQYYYQVLFKPGVSVQTRELNILQNMLQNQIEKFGDNIFQSGTIVSGCNFQFLNPYPYVQLSDLDVFNNIVVPSSYLGFNATNQNGLVAQVLNFANGFQSTPPNLKTIYVKYVNTGNTGQNLTSFAAGDTLTIQNPVIVPIQGVNVINGGTGFSNSNVVIAVSQINVLLNSGTAPTVGTFMNNGNGLTNVQITAVTSLGANAYNIQYQPRQVDLANNAANSQFWTFNIGDSLTSPSASFNMTVNQILGSGLTANIVTNGIGTILSVPIFVGGTGYTLLPFITVQSPGNLVGYNNLNLTGQNFLTQVTVASGANTTGNGYAFGVSNGVIYQKGFFLQVQPQVIVVSPFNTLPDNVAVGFTTLESIVNYNIDSSLLDNANGQLNFQAPGADRMQLVPQLQVLPMANVIANSLFLPLVQWNAGNPFEQQQQTVYATIEQEIAQRTEDTSGNFVLDPFVITTTSNTTSNTSAQYFTIVSDPGEAYINGYKVKTFTNYQTTDTQGTSTIVNNAHAISLNYGNYLIVKNIGGYFSFNLAAQVNLYNAGNSATNWLPGASLNANGTLIGTANIRSMRYYQGNPGTSTEQRLLYLFNVQMNGGYSFNNTTSIAYNTGGSNVGICDVVLVQSQSNAQANVTGIANLINTNLDQLVFYSGVPILKNANNISYTYRTVNTTFTVSNGGVVNASIIINISTGTETFPYGQGALSSLQLQDFHVTPTGGDMVYQTAITGTVAGNTTSAQVNGTATNFTSNLTVGQWVYYVGNSVQGHSLLQVNSIINATALTFTSNCGFVNATAQLFRCYPNNVSVPFGFLQSDLTGSVNGPTNIVTLSWGQPFSFSGTQAATVEYNVSRSNNPTQISKVANRNVWVSMCTSNNAGGQNGPWNLGVPDVFRLRGVYLGNSSVTNTGVNYVSSFYVDPGHNPDYYALSQLYIQPLANGNLPITSNTYILVNFDYFTGGTGGFYDTVSYTQTSNAQQLFLQDSQNLVSLSAQTFCNTWEVPEIFLDDGQEIDLLGYFDFRPYASNTSNPSSSSSGLPALNPANTLTIASAAEHKFPLPSSTLTATIEGWLGRIDSLYIDQNGNFTVGTGPSVANLALATPASQPVGTMKLVDIVIPPYPSLVNFPSSQQQAIMQTNIVINQHVTTRFQRQAIYNLAANTILPYNQPQVWTQAQIGSLASQIQQLFNVVALNGLEANSAAQLIPSSANNGFNRTSYGIFTDNFTTSNFSNLTDPAYAAIKQGPNVVPDKFLWDMTFYGQPQTPYINFPIVRQDIATVGGVTDPLGLGPMCALNLSNTVAYKLAFRNAQDILSTNTPSGLIDTVSLQFASQAQITGTLITNQGSITQQILSQGPGVYGLGTAYFGGGESAGNLFNWVPGQLGINLFQLILSAGIVAAGYDPGSQTIHIISYPAHPLDSYIYGVPPSVGNAFVSALNGGLNWSSFFGGLQVNNNVPSGGTYVAGLYYPPVAFYFYNYTQQTAYNIYQNGTLVASSNPSKGVPTCQNLNAADIAMLEGSAAEFWFNDYPNLYMKNFVQGSQGYVSYAGKILFNYNPQLGSNFVITSTSQPTTDMWRWVMAYPINGSAAGCVSPTPVAHVSGTVSPIYATYNFSSYCGNGDSGTGQVTILSGYNVTWNQGLPTPTTSIVPFNAAQDWQV